MADKTDLPPSYFEVTGVHTTKDRCDALPGYYSNQALTRSESDADTIQVFYHFITSRSSQSSENVVAEFESQRCLHGMERARTHSNSQQESDWVRKYYLSKLLNI